MQRARVLLLVAGVALLVGTLIFALRQSAEAQRAREELLAANARNAGLTSRLQVAVAAAGRPMAAPVAAPQPAPPEPPPAPTERDRGPGRRWDRMADLANDPEIAPLVLKQRQRQVAARYAALFARLGLGSEQSAQLQTLLAEKEMSALDARRLARMQGLGREDGQEIAQEAVAESDSAIRALLGEAGFTQLEEFDRTYGERSTVNSLALQLVQTGAPLSVAQQEQLVGILAASSTGMSAASASTGGPWGGRGGFGVFGPDSTAADVDAAIANKAASDAAALEAAAAFLTPTQLQALHASQEASTDDLRLAALRMDRIRAMRARRE